MIRLVKNAAGTLSLFTIVLLSCSYESSLYDFMTNSPIKINIVQQSTSNFYNLQISAPADVTQLYYCVNVAKGGCAPANARENFTATQSTKNATGTTLIFTATQPLPIENNTQISIVAQNSSQILRHVVFETASGNPIEYGLSLLNKETMLQELTHFTDDKYRGRLSATPENDELADWLIENLKKLNIAPANGTDYRQPFTMTRGPTNGKKSANIVGLIPGTDPQLKEEYIIIGAHMDHAGESSGRGYTCTQKGAGDVICNGADDNGSGTISVLNIAKSLAAVRTNLKRSVIIMWFSGEEEGLIGSYYYVKNPIIPLEKTKYMINMDMVGYAKSYNSTLDAIGGDKHPHAKKVIEEIRAKYPNIRVKFTNQVGGGSDHEPFFDKKIPGVFWHTGVSSNPNYHKTSDHVDKIDFDGMLTISKIAFEHLFRMANDAELTNTYFKFDSIISPDFPRGVGCHSMVTSSYVEEVTDYMLNGPE